ncbi:MAG TPA: SufE family protein [Opitutaceae bacterium]|nr:SufE family protein [Opitutaceae bacterium]
MPSYPPNLADIVEFFDALPDDDKRDNLIAYADAAPRCAPQDGQSFALEDVRKDEECTDTVGVFLNVGADRRAHFAISLGPHVQTLTKAMAAILCKGLDGATPEEILEVPQDFVPRIVGGQLVRLRSQTVYYILTRLKSICKVWLNRERAAAAG